MLKLSRLSLKIFTSLNSLFDVPKGNNEIPPSDILIILSIK